MSDKIRPDAMAYSLEEVAELTGFSVRTLLDGCRAGEIPHTCYRSRRVMTRQHIAEFLTRYEQRPSADRQRAEDVARIEEHRQRVANRLARRAGKAAAA